MSFQEIQSMIEHAQDVIPLLVWLLAGTFAVIGAVMSLLILSLAWAAKRLVKDLDSVKTSMVGIRDALESIERAWTDKLHGVTEKVHELQNDFLELKGRIKVLERFHDGDRLQDK